MKKLIFSLGVLLSVPALGEDYTSALGTAAQELVEAGRFFNTLGLCSATAGNFSKRIDQDLIAITVSGKHKGELCREDVILINLEGTSLDPTKKSSAETALHTVVYRHIPQAGSVLHTHSVSGTVLSRLLAPARAFITEGYEIHKIFPGISTHESTLELPIFENSQDYVALSTEIAGYLETHPQTVGFFLRGHGLYTWGKDVKEAQIRTEAFEFLFDCELKIRTLQ